MDHPVAMRIQRFTPYIAVNSLQGYTQVFCCFGRCEDIPIKIYLFRIFALLLHVLSAVYALFMRERNLH